MSPQERRDANRAKEQQQQQAKQAETQAKNKETEDNERLEFDKAKLEQRQKEFKQKKKESKSVNKRMKKALKLKQADQDRKAQNRKDAAEDKKRAQLEKNVKTAQKAVDARTNKMKKLKVGFDNVEKDDGLGTAFSKFGGNMTQLGSKTGQGVYQYMKRRGDKKALNTAKQELDDFKNPPKKKPKVGSVTIDRSAAEKEKKEKSYQTGKQQGPRERGGPITRKPEEKGGALAIRKPAEKGGALAIRKKSVGGALANRAKQKVSSIVSTRPKESDAQRARRDPAFRKKLMQQREEFLYEIDKMKKEKVDKVINVMRGKNKIETMPKVSESKDWRDDYKPLEFETVDLIKPEPLKPSDWRKDIEEASAAWTRKAGKKKSGGLNEKGRKSYERENPGSDLKAPSKKVGNPRRKSFCARMKGMKKKLTSSKTANDPDSRINKSLRAWNC
tara:strand:- start:465 stop:1799 length:1335 start_codon:yes stop_codon:yes gene_type:complete